MARSSVWTLTKRAWRLETSWRAWSVLRQHPIPLPLRQPSCHAHGVVSRHLSSQSIASRGCPHIVPMMNDTSHFDAASELLIEWLARSATGRAVAQRSARARAGVRRQVTASFAVAAAPLSDQSAVWEEVALRHRRTGTRSATSALRDA